MKQYPPPFVLCQIQKIKIMNTNVCSFRQSQPSPPVKPPLMLIDSMSGEKRERCSLRANESSSVLSVTHF